MNKILTVIVPSYNMEKYLPSTLDSLIVSPLQMETLEVIVVNDGSNDRTSEIGREFCTRWPDTFKIIDKKNGHYGSCVNAALPIASGMYIRILDADDSVDRDNFSDFLSKVEAWSKMDAPPDMIVADHCTVNENGVVVASVHYGLPSDRLITPDEILDYTHANIGVQAVVHRTGNLRALSYRQMEGTPYTDTQWSLDPIVGVRYVAYYPKLVTRYLFGREGQTMEPIQFARNAAKQALVSLAIYRRFSDVRKNPMPFFGKYYRSSVLANMHWVYSLFVFGCEGIFPEDNGGWFDREVRCILPDLGQEVETRWKTKTLRFYWLREWRKNGYSRTSVKFSLYFMQHAISGLVRKLIGK